MPLLRVICWAIIFLTRIRFPPDVSIAHRDDVAYHHEDDIYNVDIYNVEITNINKNISMSSEVNCVDRPPCKIHVIEKLLPLIHTLKV